MLKKLSFMSLIIILVLFYMNGLVFAYGVNPLNLFLAGSPGDIIPFEIKLTPAGRQEIVNLNLYDAVQEISGELKFTERKDENNNAMDWINFDDSRIVIPPDREVLITGTVDIPYDASGSYTVILMVEPEKREGEIGIIMNVRYAIRLDIFVDRPGLRPRGEITEIGIKGDKDMNPLIYTKIKNISKVNLAVASEVTIRTEDRRLLDRVVLRSPATAQSGRDYLVIYRDSEVQFEGVITEPLPAGTYDLRIFLRYNNGQQLVRGKKITVTDEYFHPDRIQYVEIEPLKINENLRPGGAVAEAIQIRNRVDEELMIKIGSQEIETEYPHSIFTDFNFELRGDSEIKLVGRRETRQVLIIRAPRDIKPGGYYGKISLQVYNLEDKLLESHQIPLDVIVGELQDLSVEVKNLNVIVENENILFSITTNNTSSKHIVPEAVLNLKKGEEILRTYNLYLNEGVERILPLHSAVMFTEVSLKNINPGEYKADITVYENDNILLEKEFDVLIPDKEEEKK